MSCRHRRGLGEPDLLRAMPALRTRIEEVEAQLRANDARRADIAAQVRPELDALQAQLHDLLLLAEARAQVRTGELLFVIEGWMPEPAVEPLRARVARELGSEIVVAQVGTEPWTRADAPVALANPRAVPALRADHARVPAAALRLDRSDAVRRRVLPDVLRADAGRRRLRAAARRDRRGAALALTPEQYPARGRGDGTGMRAVRDRVRRAVRRVLRQPWRRVRHASARVRPRECPRAVPDVHHRARRRPRRARTGARGHRRVAPGAPAAGGGARPDDRDDRPHRARAARCVQGAAHRASSRRRRSPC